jgi:16S rRNA (cytosine1402-N4)-methyltransferase
MPSEHQPVLLEEALAALACQPGKLYVDATVGGGGHAREILRRSSPDGRLIGADRDPAALARAAERLAPFAGRFELLHANFRALPAILRSRGLAPIAGALLDLGLSSDQLADPARGFSFTSPGPLDMRMDPATARSAADLVNASDEPALRAILRTYGEEPHAGRIARAIVRARESEGPIVTADRLARIVSAAVPRRAAAGAIHPATRTFQALRIAVNDELAALEEALDGMLELLAPGGRLVVIAFHSLEDRIVKRRFTSWSGACTCPPGLPVCGCGARARARMLSRRAVRPSAEEVAANPRARSARMRAAERLREAA